MKSVSATLVIRLAIGVSGLAAIGYGLFLALTTLRRWPDVISAALWFGLPPLVFDLLLVPVIGLLGGLVATRARPRWRPPLITGLIISGALLVIAAPFVSGIGRRADNPSLLDRPYLLGTVVALAVIWAGAALWGLLRKEN
ncbi:hypothetical protein [Microlunatus parietis]|uniref:CHASE2 domain-containing sensor protein n=1 Tax=Microlunatus parietis TaxID=682979 RepID=A0A7Y9LDK0_9ACTN|nr:hypothetical protein [Microlunatus parietis]NYE73982.1 CHASE2 domain-containing sensor protein [Microlunatus parietis]